MSNRRIRDEDLADYREAFDHFDRDGSGYIDKNELDNLLEKLRIGIPQYKLKTLKNDYGDTIDFDEFQDIIGNHSTALSGVEFLNMLTKKQVEHTGGTSKGSAQGTTHSFSKSEATAFADWINYQLEDDEELQKLGYIPLDVSSDGDVLFKKAKSGVLLCKLINATVEDTIDTRVINMAPDSTFAVHENQTLAINSAISIGCRVVNIGPEDLASGKQHLVLGLMWQVIRLGLFSHITISEVPGLRRLMSEGSKEEKDNELRKKSPEELLMLWVNYHLELAGSPRRISNFGEDLQDSEVYSVLLTRLAAMSDINIAQTSHIQDESTRADGVLKNAQTMGCKRFITKRDIMEGNEKLNLAFVANLFNMYPCLPADGEDDINLESQEDGLNETREEKTYRNWMNSLGANPFVTWIYTDLYDGHVLFQLFEKISPGIVDWTRVVSRQKCASKIGGHMKKIENCSYAVELGRKMNFSLVGIGGKDIHDGNETATLALLWQMMQAYTLFVLRELVSNDRGIITEGEIISWVQDELSKAQKPNTITSFRDPSICDSLAVIDLIDVISLKSKNRGVDYKLVKDGTTDEEKMQNARYALSLARKIGAQIYALPEDLVEVKSKMVLTVFACLMACSLKIEKKNQAKSKPGRR